VADLGPHLRQGYGEPPKRFAKVAASLVAVRITSVGNRPHAEWAEGLRVHLPAGCLDRIGWRRAIRSNGDLDVPPDPPSISDEDIVWLREARAFTERPPLSARMPVNYRLVPGWARALAASAVGRWNRRKVDRWAVFPGWPIDLSVDVLDDLRSTTPESGGSSQTAWQSKPGPTPVVLTHDIDSAEGLQNLVSRFLPMEEAVGARSTSYIVPCDWRVDHGLVDEVASRGHHLGVHGYDHSNRTPFAASEERARRLDAAKAFAERYGATGYRAPSLLRTRELLRDVGSRYRYDTSIPTSGGLFPTANNGCATARPFVVEDAVELPISLPRDGSLRFLGYSADEIPKMWMDCADLVRRSRGVVVLLTHCERRFSGDPGMIRAYDQFLRHIAGHGRDFAFSTADAVLQGTHVPPRVSQANADSAR
jgi:peptidoglycan/xylan/chitin deacetylase (PgdA/CDA1 family)